MDIDILQKKNIQFEFFKNFFNFVSVVRGMCN